MLLENNMSNKPRTERMMTDKIEMDVITETWQPLVLLAKKQLP